MQFVFSSSCSPPSVSDSDRCFLPVQQLISQQKDGDAEEKQKMAAEKEAQQKRISQLTEELARLKSEVAR